jgi:hypothetical protein
MCLPEFDRELNPISFPILMAAADLVRPASA